MKAKKDNAENIFDSYVSKSERQDAGKALRKKCLRQSHSILNPRKKGVDPVAILKHNSKGRVESLIPIRYGRMIESPFAFYRGAASIMANDLSHTPSTGMHLQVCGDCHLMNFGGFATPERKMVFDINDFDETTVGPWEWDLKRLAASFYIAARWKGFSEMQCEETAWYAANSYKKHIAEYAKLSALQVWYASIDLKELIKEGKENKLNKARLKRIQKAQEQSSHEKEFAKLTFQTGEHARIKDNPPLIYHGDPENEKESLRLINVAFEKYLQSLSHDRKVLLRRYKLQDVAMKVVGVGSVGTLCGIILLMSASGDPLFLQFKEARASVLEPFVGKSKFSNHGQRVVEGQKIMQSASDAFLGWTKGESGRDFYVRQLRDAKIKPILEVMTFTNFCAYARACGWATARAHARTGDASMLLGYLGTGQAIEDSIARFAKAYADQNEKDHKALLGAVRKGIVQVQMEK